MDRRGEPDTEVDEASRALIRDYGRSFAQGDVLIREGEEAVQTFVLHQGKARLLKRVGGVERTVAVLRPGDLFGEGALLSGTRSPSTAVALSDGALVALDREALLTVLQRFPAVAERLVTQLASRLQDAEDRIEILMMGDAQSKVVAALLKMAGGAPGPVALTVSPVDLATWAALDVDSVKRLVQRLRDQQYVRIAGERVEIPDVDALRRLYALLETNATVRGAR